MTSQLRDDAASDDELLAEAVAQLTFVVSARIATVAASQDLSATQLRLLGILRDHEPRISDLARHLGLDRSSVSGLLDRAESRGLVRRHPDPHDGRATRVALTEHGRIIAELLAAQATAEILPLFSPLAPRVRMRLTALLQQLLPSAPGDAASAQ